MNSQPSSAAPLVLGQVSLFNVEDVPDHVLQETGVVCTEQDFSGAVSGAGVGDRPGRHAEGEEAARQDGAV